MLPSLLLLLIHSAFSRATVADIKWSATLLKPEVSDILAATDEPRKVRCPRGWNVVGGHCVTVVGVPPYTECSGDYGRFRRSKFKEGGKNLTLSPDLEGICEELTYLSPLVRCVEDFDSLLESEGIENSTNSMENGEHSIENREKLFENSIQNRENSIKNREYSVENQEYLVENQEYSFKNQEYSVENQEYSVENQEYSVENGEYLVENGEYLVENGEYLVENREYSVENREYSVENGVNSMGDFAKTGDQMANRQKRTGEKNATEEQISERGTSLSSETGNSKRMNEHQYIRLFNSVTSPIKKLIQLSEERPYAINAQRSHRAKNNAEIIEPGQEGEISGLSPSKKQTEINTSSRGIGPNGDVTQGYQKRHIENEETAAHNKHFIDLHQKEQKKSKIISGADVHCEDQQLNSTQMGERSGKRSRVSCGKGEKMKKIVKDEHAFRGKRVLMCERTRRFKGRMWCPPGFEPAYNLLAAKPFGSALQDEEIKQELPYIVLYSPDLPHKLAKIYCVQTVAILRTNCNRHKCGNKHLAKLKLQLAHWLDHKLSIDSKFVDDIIPSGSKKV